MKISLIMIYPFLFIEIFVMLCIDFTRYSKSDRTKEKTMSYLKTTCWAVGTVATLLILYSQRQSIAKLLFSRKAAKKRGMVKSKKLDDEEDYVFSYFEQGQPSDSPSLVLFHGFTRHELCRHNYVAARRPWGEIVWTLKTCDGYM